jgi:hypothetical protein
MIRRSGNKGGYGFKDSGDKQLGLAGDGGVWTRDEREQERIRWLTAKREAAQTAEAAMQTAIDGIRNDEGLTHREKFVRLSRLNYTGYSDREYRMLMNARADELRLSKEGQ